MINIKGTKGLAKYTINYVVISKTNYLSFVAMDKDFYSIQFLYNMYIHALLNSSYHNSI